MDCVILFRNPSNGRVGFISDEDGEPTVFFNFERAVDCADSHPLLQAWPYQIVECDEL